MGVGLGLEGGGGGGSRKILKPQDQDYKILLPRFFFFFCLFQYVFGSRILNRSLENAEDSLKLSRIFNLSFEWCSVA